MEGSCELALAAFAPRHRFFRRRHLG